MSCLIGNQRVAEYKRVGRGNKTVSKAVCECCGKEFQPKRNRYSRFCSIVCKTKYIVSLRWAKTERKPKVAPREFADCAVCGKKCKSRLAKYCSDECLVISRRQRQVEKDRAGYVPKKLTCQYCHKEFEREYRGRRSFCSGACAKKAEQAQKNLTGSGDHRARVLLRRFYGKLDSSIYEPIKPIKVYERDNYKCWICGTKLEEKFLPLKDNSPTIDHKKPLAKGGTHTYNNVGACCFKCNSGKGDSYSG